MKKVTLELGFIEYSSLEEMDPQDQEVVKAAIAAQKSMHGTRHAASTNKPRRRGDPPPKRHRQHDRSHD